MNRLFFVLLVATVCWTPAPAQCPAEPPLQNYTGGGTTACPCFIPNEEAGAIFTLPASVHPIEILRVGIAWGSQFGGAPQSLEQAINIYEGGLPDPGIPIFSLSGPTLNDGVINEFDLEPLPGEIVVNSSPFTVTLEFLNQNAADPFSPTVVHDGNGCQPGKNIVKSIPGGWNDACLLGATSATFSPSNFDTYYLAVPQSASTEGTYGTNDATGLPRPTGGSQCEGQVAGVCP